MINREELADYLDELLSCSAFSDYSPNGIQVEGVAEIKRICTAVTASIDVINEAILREADALLVHHGYFWRGEEAVITGMKRQRIAKLLDCGLSLFAYHLPLDCHLFLGNNACLAQLFNVELVKQHVAGKTPNLLWSGALIKPITAMAFSRVINEKLGREPLHIAGSDKLIKTIAWCSGAAQDFIEDAYFLGVDAFLSGEVSERTYYQAKELGIHYFACGHHATERYGIQAVGSHLATKFKLEHYFIDSSNPV